MHVHKQKSAPCVSGTPILLNKHVLLDKSPLPYQHIRLYKHALVGRHVVPGKISSFGSTRYSTILNSERAIIVSYVTSFLKDHNGKNTNQHVTKSFPCQTESFSKDSNEIYVVRGESPAGIHTLMLAMYILL